MGRMKTVKVHVSKLEGSDPMSVLLTTKGHTNFLSSLDNKNKATFVNNLNLILVSGDKNYVGKYMADWFITISNDIINSDLIDKGNGYEVVNITVPKKIQLVADSRKDNIAGLQSTIMSLLSFNESIKMIKMTKNHQYAIEDETGKTMLGESVLDMNCCPDSRKKTRKRIHQK